MTPDQRTKCHIAIHAASAAAAGVGAGLAQLPGSDAPAIVTIQVGLAFALAKIFKIQISEAAARASIFTAAAMLSGPIIARTVTQFLIGWIPGVGNGVNAATAAAITEAIGWVLADEYDKQAGEGESQE
jgi:uncharacterized protein (DUF697 family)